MHYFVSRLSIVKPLGSTYFNFPSSETFQTENPCKWRQQIHFNFGVSVFSVLIIQKYECSVNKIKLIVTYEPGAVKVLFSVLKKEFEDENLLESDRDVTISIEDVKAEKPKSSADFTAADDDPLSSDDKTEVWTETYGFLWCDKFCIIDKLLTCLIPVVFLFWSFSLDKRKAPLFGHLSITRTSLTSRPIT